jgi:hypothetical protein
VYLIRFRYRNTYDAKHDSFRIIFLIVPCAFLSLMLNEAFTIMEVHPIFFFLLVQMIFPAYETEKLIIP